MINKILLVFAGLLLLCGCKAKDTGTDSGVPQLPTVQLSEGKKAVQDGEAMTGEQAKPNLLPRVISVDVTPQYPKAGDTIKVTVTAADPDGDEFKLSYQWFKNTELLPEASDSMKLTDAFVRGDRINLIIIPDDGKGQGSPGRMQVTIGNAPPEITSSSSDIKLENRKFTYKVTASDRENDPLAYSLKASPAGMTIDASTGLVQWDVPPGFKEKTPITIYVKDDHGGEAVQDIIFEMNY